MLWRRLLPVLFLPALLCASFGSASGGDVVVNGSFETTDFTGWSRTYDSNTHWYVLSGTTSPTSHHTIPAPYPGSYQAVADQSTGPNTGPTFLYQDVTLPDAYHVWLKVRYYFANYDVAYINPADFSVAHPNQQVRIDLVDPAAPLDDLGSGVLRNLVATTPATPLIVGPNPTRWEVTELAGRTVRLRIAVVTTGAPLVVCIDGVSAFDSAFEETVPAVPGLWRPAVAWGDVDGDEDVDLAVSGSLSSDPLEALTRVYRNDEGGFTDMAQGLVAAYGGAVRWGDCDADGDLDLLVMGTGPVTRIYRNTGGVLTDLGAGLPGLGEGDAAWGDYDNDGDLDLALAGNTGSAYLSEIYRNDADGFHAIGAGLPGAVWGSVQWADVDNDGDLDLLLQGKTTDSPLEVMTRIYRNDGGTFTDASAGLPGLYSASADFGDMDNDGDLDLVVTGRLADDTPVARVYRNDAGAFADIGAGLPGIWNGEAAWGDCDNDGDPDLALAGDTGQGYLAAIYLNTGGTFTDIEAGLTGVRRCALAWGDFDDDLDLDLLVAGETTTGYITRIYQNTHPDSDWMPEAPAGLSAQVGSGFQVMFEWDAASDHETPASGLSYNLQVGTAAGSGDVVPPMVRAGGEVRLLPALGNAQMMRSRVIRFDRAGVYHWTVQAIDTEFRGGVFADEDSVEVAQFQVATSGLPPLTKGAVQWGDFDADGDLDVAICGGTISGDVLRVYRNNGGSFTNMGAALTGVHEGKVVWTDYDADGYLDLLALGTAGIGGSPSTSLYRFDGSTFAAVAAGFVGVTRGDAGWADFDRDGDLDLALCGATAGASTCRIYRNDGGSFADIGAPLAGVEDASLDWGDTDGDGRPDLLVTGTAMVGAVTLLYRNLGDGGFSAVSSGLPSTTGGVARFGDYNNDGDLDVILTGTAVGVASPEVWDNSGGSFTPHGAGLAGLSNATAAWGDCDNDGDLDLVVGGKSILGTATAYLYRNDDGAFHAVPIGATGFYNAALSLGDADNDGDLDLLVVGYRLLGAAFTSLYLNQNPVADTVPESPGGLAAALAGNLVTFSWTAATDAETPSPGLSYNLRMGTAPGGFGRVPPLADAATGYRRVARDGNCGHRNLLTMPWTALPGDGPVYWAVQAVDPALAGSPFSAEGTFSLTPLIDSLTDRPDDEGGYMLCGVEPSPFDVMGGAKVLRRYEIWRRFSFHVPSTFPTTGDGPPFPPGAWALVDSFDATGAQAYQREVPTLADSSAGGVTWTAIVVRAVRIDDTWVQSPPDSGYSVNDAAVGVGEPGPPERYALLAASPNPFGASTRIAFTLPEASAVELAIYDAAGRRVRTLAGAVLPAGRHAVTWDGRDERGLPTAGGIYFYRLRAGAYAETRRMVRLR